MRSPAIVAALRVLLGAAMLDRARRDELSSAI
jgi:hypothetical protein